MKKLVLLAMLLGLAIPATASAKTLEGRVGVGGEAGLSTGGGLSVRYWAGNLGFQGVLGMTIITDGDDDDIDESSSQLNLAARVLYNFARTEQTNMYVGGGVGLGLIDADYFAIDLLLGVEHFFSDWFAVSGIVGVPIAIGDDATRIDIGTVVHWGGGFHFYF